MGQEPRGSEGGPKILKVRVGAKRREVGILAGNQKGLDGLLSSRKGCRGKREV